MAFQSIDFLAGGRVPEPDRAVQAAGIKWNEKQAHTAIYDAERTADLFCRIVNTWDENITSQAMTGTE